MTNSVGELAKADGQDVNVLLTGSTGLIGSHLTKALLADRYNVYAIVRDAHKLSALLGNDRRGQLTVLQGDLLSENDLERLAHDILQIGRLHVVIHTAGGGPLTSNQKFAAAISDLNYGTTCNLIHLLERTHKLKSLSLLLYYSSLAAMGLPSSKNGRVIYDETTAPDPVLPYERAKLKTEEFLKELTRNHQFKTVVLRFPQVYGTRDDALMQMIRLMRKRAFPVVRNRVGTLPLIHVKDAVKATCNVVKHVGLVQDNYDVNLVCEGSYSFDDLAEVVRRKYGKGNTLKLPYSVMYLATWAIESLFKSVGKPEPLNRRRMISMTKDRIIDCRRFQETYHFECDQNVEAFLAD